MIHWGSFMMIYWSDTFALLPRKSYFCIWANARVEVHCSMSHRLSHRNSLASIWLLFSFESGLWTNFIHSLNIAVLICIKTTRTPKWTDRSRVSLYHVLKSEFRLLRVRDVRRRAVGFKLPCISHSIIYSTVLTYSMCWWLNSVFPLRSATTTFIVAFVYFSNLYGIQCQILASKALQKNSFFFFRRRRRKSISRKHDSHTILKRFGDMSKVKVSEERGETTRR